MSSSLLEYIPEQLVERSVVEFVFWDEMYSLTGALKTRILIFQKFFQTRLR